MSTTPDVELEHYEKALACIEIARRELLQLEKDLTDGVMYVESNRSAMVVVMRANAVLVVTRPASCDKWGLTRPHRQTVLNERQALLAIVGRIAAHPRMQ